MTTRSVKSRFGTSLRRLREERGYSQEELAERSGVGVRTIGDLEGQERLTETLSEDSVLDGQFMPKAITCGSFHALADFDATNEPEIGWHPEFEKLVKGTKGNS